MAAQALIAGVVALGLVTAALPLHAQPPPSKVFKIGVLGERAPGDPFITAFRQGLRDLGYSEGYNVVIEYRYAGGVTERFGSLAGELARRDVDVLVVGGTEAAAAAKRVTTTVPIVFVLPGDPVQSGLVASLARPGGNATGLSTILPGLSQKHLELLKQAVPHLSRVAVLQNPGNPVAGTAVLGLHEAARALAIDVHVVAVRRPNELASAFLTVAAWRPGALVVLSDPVFGTELGQVATLAAKHRLPSIYVRREFAETGGLMAYGPSFSDNWRRSATYVDKILKGAKPADLPVEQPTKVEFVINLRTARALGLTLPPSLLGRADEVIE